MGRKRRKEKRFRRKIARMSHRHGADIIIGLVTGIVTNLLTGLADGRLLRTRQHRSQDEPRTS